MQFTPKSEEQIQKEEQERSFLWEAGLYGFEIIEGFKFGQNYEATSNTKSKNDNDMIKLVVRVSNHEGRQQIIMDYLLEAMPSKLRHAAYACGLGDKYELGNLSAEQFIGKSGMLELAIKKGELKDKNDPQSERYSDRNSIKDYCVATEEKPLAKPVSLDDEIPF
jgi:hypothetical protein